jgi:hypothetical protein
MSGSIGADPPALTDRTASLPGKIGESRLSFAMDNPKEKKEAIAGIRHTFAASRKSFHVADVERLKGSETSMLRSSRTVPTAAIKASQDLLNSDDNEMSDYCQIFAKAFCGDKKSGKKRHGKSMYRGSLAITDRNALRHVTKEAAIKKLVGSGQAARHKSVKVSARNENETYSTPRNATQIFQQLTALLSLGYASRAHDDDGLRR